MKQSHLPSHIREWEHCKNRNQMHNNKWLQWCFNDELELEVYKILIPVEFRNYQPILMHWMSVNVVMRVNVNITSVLCVLLPNRIIYIHYLQHIQVDISISNYKAMDTRQLTAIIRMIIFKPSTIALISPVVQSFGLFT